MRNILAVIGVVGFISGCEDNTTCTVGTVLCTNEDGEVAADGDQQHRECSDDASRGGDEDGEFVVVEDCAAAGNACVTELVGGEQLGGCVSRECADDGIVDCLELGRTICGFADVLACSVDPDSGCQRYLSSQACLESETCVEDGQGAACVQQ